MSEKKKCYSLNNEEFNYDELDDAVKARLNDEFTPSGTVIAVYEGDAVPWKAGDFAPSDVIDTLACGASDNAGEYADDWPNCTKEQEKDLHQRIEDVVNQWADDHGLQPNFYGVQNVKELQIRILNVETEEYEVVEI